MTTATPPTQPAKTKAAKAPAAKKEPTVRRSKFAELYPDDAKLALLVEKNPKKEGSKSRERFEAYFSTKQHATVGAAREAGITYQDIAYDIGRQFITVTKVA